MTTKIFKSAKSFILTSCVAVLISGCGQEINDDEIHWEIIGAYCDFYSEYDFHAVVHSDTAFNYYRSLQASSPDKRVLPADSVLGLKPQYILAYPENFSVDRETGARFKVAAGLGKLGDKVTEAQVFKGRDHQLIDAKTVNIPLNLDKCQSFMAGCGFKTHWDYNTSDLQEPGVYYVIFKDDQGGVSLPVYFHITPNEDEIRNADGIVILSELTSYAYNNFGGGSNYVIDKLTENNQVNRTYNNQSMITVSTGAKPLLNDPSGTFPFPTNNRDVDIQAVKNLDIAALGKPSSVSPDKDMQWIRVSPEAQLAVLRSAEEKNYNLVTVSQEDIEKFPSILSHTSLLVISGHNEYWTPKMLEAFKSYYAGNGKILNLSGNLMWWKIKYDNKRIFRDDLGHLRQGECARELNKAIGNAGLAKYADGIQLERFLGVNYEYANYPISKGKSYTQEDLKKFFDIDADVYDWREDQGIRLEEPDHPIFKGLQTGFLNDHFEIFRNAQALAVEIDGIPMLADGEVDKTVLRDFDLDINILGSANAFVATLVSIPETNDYWGGVHRVGFIVEVIDDESGDVKAINFPSIGFTGLLNSGNEDAEIFLSNSIAYLKQ